MACSGYPYFGVDDLPAMELLVRATVIDVDDRGFNAIIRVEEYYKGEGPPLLPIVRYPVALATGNAVRGYDTGCLYAGRGHRWQKGSQGYFGLRSNGDGTFTDEKYGTAHFYVWDGQITYQEGRTEGYAVEFDAPLVISEEDFIAGMLEVGGREAPVKPVIEEGVQRYPLMRYLMIATQTGTRYRVNPDRSVQQLPADAPIAISPDGAHSAFRVDESIHFEHIHLDGAGDHPHTAIVPGQDVLFSKDSSLAAVWNSTLLSVYAFSNQWRSDNGNKRMSVHFIASVGLTLSDGALPVVIWSDDSSTIAWQDDAGIWRWNLFEEAIETRAVALDETEAAVKLLDLSISGRYLRYSSSQGWTLFDSQTQATYSNALVSPDERFLIFADHVPDSRDRRRDSPYPCYPPLQQNCALHINIHQAAAVFPYQMELLGIAECDSQEVCAIAGVSWHFSVDEHQTGYIGGRNIDISTLNVRQIAYDPFYDRPAVLRGDYQIEFRFYHDHYFQEEKYLPYLDYLDLEDELDSPIASIQWGQPIFYDTFMLTATSYLP